MKRKRKKRYLIAVVPIRRIMRRMLGSVRYKKLRNEGRLA